MRLIRWARRDAADGRALVALQQPKQEIVMPNPNEPNALIEQPADPEQEIIVAAAVAHHRAVAERDKMFRMIEEGNAALKMKNEQLMQMEVAIAEERNRGASYRAEADELVRENSRLGEGLVNIKATLALLVAQLEALALPLPPEKRRRRKSNGGDTATAAINAAAGEIVFDPVRGAGEVAEGAPVLAHGAPVLGQRTGSES